ncbi:MAG: hypothetical protein H6581_25100 [Bacteroidia bacterium]|nr:hypothetical protein [Bacteroidia bacterium]
MSELKIILVVAPDYPEMGLVRKQLRAALQSLGWMPAWQEIQAGNQELPSRFRSLQGPFVLANGKWMAVEEAEIMAKKFLQVQKQSSRWSWLRKPLSTGSVLPGILLAFFPKCAGCWAAYMSVFGSMGMGLPYLPWLKHVLAGSLVLSAWYFARMARRRNRWIPFGFQMSGFVLVILTQYLIGLKFLLWPGVALVFAGSLLYAMPDTWMRRLEGLLGLRKVAEA